jgi:hypothetical protein
MLITLFVKFLIETVKKEERFIMVHGFRSFNPRSAGSIALKLRHCRISWRPEHTAEAAHLMATRKQREKDERAIDKPYPQ